MITQDLAALAVNARGLDALGLASGQLATLWSTAAVAFDEPSLRLSTTGTWRVMAGSTLQWHVHGALDLSDVGGNPLTQPVAVLRLHPQTHLRLARLYLRRFDTATTARSTRPVPYAIAFHAPQFPPDINVNSPTDPPPRIYDGRLGQALAGDGWQLGGALSFHDERGLILDPVAVACAWRDLLVTSADLVFHGEVAGDLSITGTPAAGGLGQISLLGTPGRWVHAVDLHGGPFTSASGVRVGGVDLGAAPVVWPSGQTINVSATPTPLRWSLATSGTLGAEPLAVPAFPSGSPDPVLRRDFFRVAVVHLERHLLGNRSATAVDGVPAADSHTQLDEAPAVRDTETLTLLVDGQATLGAMQASRTGASLVLAAAPAVENDFELPVDASARWPAHPAAIATAAAWSPAKAGLVRTDWTARFIGNGNDVELVLAGGIAPLEAHVRVFPRLFVEGGALAEQATAQRGDGAATIVRSATETVRLRLRDPLGLGSLPRPANALLRFDVVVVPRPADAAPRARLFGGLSAPIGTGGGEVPAPALPEGRTLVGVPLDRRGEARAPLLGLPRTPSAGEPVGQILQALSEATPRESPRYPTMARNDAVLAASNAGAWTSVLATGWLAKRSVQGDARLGNPGNPAGPEEQVIGVRAQGRLGYDLGRAALRRARHLLPRLVQLKETTFDLPAAPTTGTHAAAVLQTIAPRCESPELGVLDPDTVPNAWTALRTQLLGIWPTANQLLPATVTAPEPQNRMIAEVRREGRAVKKGRRDAQWALRWQIAHARRLVYLETMLFGHTADSGAGDHTWDLVEALRARLVAVPDLRVLIALPRIVPFGPGYEGWAKHFYAARTSAIQTLVDAAPGRVVAFHPIGFAGRAETVRGSAVIVDDVWALIGTSTLSRRGLTFDGGLDVSLFDRQLVGGASLLVRDLRRRLLARALGLSAPAAGVTPEAGWVRLAQMRSAFALVAETLELGGQGNLQPLWPGPADVLAQDPRLANPDGRDFDAALLVGSLLATLVSLAGTGGPGL